MEIVIKIPNFEWLKNEEDFKTAVKEYEQGTRFDKEIRNALINGIPLPEHHGRLIDISKIDEDKMEQDNPIICITMNDGYIEAVSLDYLNGLPTIIEADKESE